MTELEKCPFCGGEAELGHTDRNSEYGNTSFVFCKECSANGKMVRVSSKYSSDERAIEAWNRRTFTSLVNITEEVRNVRDRGWCDQSMVLDKVNDDISKAWNTRV